MTDIIVGQPATASPHNSALRMIQAPKPKATKAVAIPR